MPETRPTTLRLATDDAQALAQLVLDAAIESWIDEGCSAHTQGCLAALRQVLSMEEEDAYLLVQRLARPDEA